MSFIFEVKFKFSLTDDIVLSVTSRVLSILFFSSLILEWLISKPRTLYFFENSTANGKPR